MLSEKPWQGRRVILFLMTLLFCFIWVSMALELAQNFGIVNLKNQESFFSLFLSTMSLHGTILLVTCLFLWWEQINWNDAFGFSKASSFRVMILGALAGLILFPVGFGLRLLCARLFYGSDLNAPEQQAVELLDNARGTVATAYFVFFSVVIAPAAEEMLFRGIFYPAVKQLGYPKLALWGTALVFALIHMNWVILIPLFILGLVLAMLYEKTNNLLATITAHSVFNACNLVLYFLVQHLASKH